MSILGKLVFIGLGLYSEKDVSLRGLEEIKEADAVFVELYTSLMPALSIQTLDELTAKKVRVISRRNLEEESGQSILDAAKKGKAVFLVPGDPLIATTHLDLRIRAEKQGIKTHVIHGASIVSAAMGLSGLQNYKYGRSVTIPFAHEGYTPETPYEVIMKNKKLGLHTLCFLDSKAEEGKYMTVKGGLRTLLLLEERRRHNVITADTLVVGVARAGSEQPIVKADYVQNAVKYDFGSPPHTLIFPGKLHFMEVEALITLAKAPPEIGRMAK